MLTRNYNGMWKTSLWKRSRGSRSARAAALKRGLTLLQCKQVNPPWVNVVWERRTQTGEMDRYHIKTGWRWQLHTWGWRARLELSLGTKIMKRVGSLTSKDLAWAGSGKTSGVRIFRGRQKVQVRGPGSFPCRVPVEVTAASRHACLLANISDALWCLSSAASHQG